MKILKYTLSTIVVFALLVGVSGAYAYNSVTVTKGDLLFSLKSATENIEVAMASDGLETVKKNLKMADRRMAEAKFLAVEGEFNSATKISLINVAYAQDLGITNLVIAQTVDEAVENTETAISETNSITDTQELSQALDSIEITQTLIVEDLLTIAENVSDIDENVALVVASAISDVQENLNLVQEASTSLDETIVSGDNEIKVDLLPVRERRGKTPITQEEAQIALATLIANKAGIESAILENVEDSQKAQEMIDRLNSKIDQVTLSIENGNFNQAKGLLNASQAISENIERFAEHREENKQKREEKLKEWEEKREQLKKDYEDKREEYKNKKEKLREEHKDLTEEEKEVLRTELENAQVLDDQELELEDGDSNDEEDGEDDEEDGDSSDEKVNDDEDEDE